MNLAELLRTNVEANPEKIALIQCAASGPEPAVTYRELDDLVQRTAEALRRSGVKVGDNVLVAIAPSINLFVVVYAALCAGATAVFVDSQAPQRVQLRAIGVAKPTCVVGPKALLRATPLLRGLRQARARICTDATLPGALKLEDLLRGPLPTSPLWVERSDEDLAFITFTSGSTGIPKGVPRSHGLMRRQHESLQNNFPMSPDEVALAGFPMLGVHTLSVGCTAALLPFDPAFGIPEVATALVERSISSAGLGPAMWRDLLPLLEATDRALPSLHYVGIGGAPLSLGVARAVTRQFPESECYCSYGSSEAEPMARISLPTFLSLTDEWKTHRETPGGYPVGVPVPEVEILVVAVGAIELAQQDHHKLALADLACPGGEVGESVVRGENVVDHYLSDAASNRRIKIPDRDGGIWHRTEDLGWIDESGCVWLVGRIKDRITLANGAPCDIYPIECILDEVPGVRRAALIAHRCRPHGECVIHERDGETVDVVAVSHVLAEFGLSVPIVRAVIPLDTRIRSKIDRVRLRATRESTLSGYPDRLLSRLPSAAQRVLISEEPAESDRNLHDSTRGRRPL